MQTLTYNPQLVSTWAHAISALVADTHAHLIYKLTHQIKNDLGADYHDVFKHAQTARLLADIRQTLGQDWQTVLTEANQLLFDAYQAGQGTALDAIKQLNAQANPQTIPPSRQLAIHQIAADLITHLSQIPPIVLREFADVYQHIMATPVTDVVLGASTRVEATQRALQRFARQGITGFVDRAGRNWSMDAYAEMATRAGAMNALRAGYHTTLTMNGFNFVIVSDHAYECAKCSPWENKVLSLNGQTGIVEMLSEISDATVKIHVEATIEQATEEGLFHPNCGHTTALYIPGVTTQPTPKHDAATYQASQKQRELERNIRANKRELITAFDDETKTEIRRKIRASQASIRQLLKDYPELARRREREQIGKAH